MRLNWRSVSLIYFQLLSYENRGSLAKLIIAELKSSLLDMQNNEMAIMKKMSELYKKELDSEIAWMKD
ncbi:hypothetical protein [Candidatus Williamhamiltonella defendens]|uniref:hypothetical protein n=1 Tax=Candidatus Williamhamiltonella defendens TaxID=138072 RepID=UPI001F3BFF89|nr:hypothetical protein [Candidatus Hamiltonella defensa]